MHYVGDYVVTPHHTNDEGEAHTGRVYKIHAHGCPEEDWWLRGQENLGDDPAGYKNVRWVSILLNSGPGRAGAVCVPDVDDYVLKVEPFEFAHRDAELYFEDDCAAD